MSAFRVGVRSVLAVSIVIGGSACAGVRGDNGWPMWLQNDRHTPAAQFRPTGSLERAWTFRSDGIFGGIAISDGVVFFGSRDGYLYAVEDATGMLLWRASVCIPGMEVEEELPIPEPALEPEAVEAEPMPALEPVYYYWWPGFPETGIMGTPCVDAERVYVGALDGHFHARDRRTGRPAWITELAGMISSSPLLLDRHGTVVVGSRGGALTAMHRETGRVVWSHDAHGPINSSPAYDAGANNVVVGVHDGVLAVNADNGTLSWRYRCERLAKFDASPVVAAERVYAASWEGEVVALGAQNGDLLWRRQVARVPIFSTPALHDDMLYVVTTRGVVAALEADSGAVAWHERLGGHGGVGAYATPVVSDPVLLVGCNDGHVTVMDRATGEQQAIIGRFEQFVRGAPTVTRDALYVISEEAHHWRTVGSVVKLVCDNRVPHDGVEVRREDLPHIACIALGLMESPQDEERWGWQMLHMSTDHLRRLRQSANADARSILQDAGVITRGWQYAGPLTRYQLAAFFHKLLWEPNPFEATLPAFEEADLEDADEYPEWVHETVPRVVGLGLMQPIEGRFMGRESVTLGDLRQALARAREFVHR